MAPITKCLALVSLALSATALTTPHISNNVFNHRRSVAHVAVQAAAVPVDVPETPKLKRSLNKRCVPKPSGNSTTSSFSTSTSVASASSVPVNVAPSPVLPTTFPQVASSSQSSTSATETPTSTYQAPTTSPTPTPTPTPTTTSQAPAQTSSTSSSGSSDGFLTGTQSGQGTFYETGLGACGETNTDTDYIAAVSHLLFDVYPGYDGVNPNTNPVCNKQVTASYGGKTVTVKITDRCTGCAIDDLDFSPSAFTQLADESLGRISITWRWT